MDEDELYTPRSGRTKKKSTLSKLALRKREKFSDEDTLSGSQASLNDRRKTSARQSLQDQSDNDTDEGISETRHYSHKSNERTYNQYNKAQRHKESDNDSDEVGEYSKYGGKTYIKEDDSGYARYGQSSSSGSTRANSKPKIRVNDSDRSPEINGRFGASLPSNSSLGFETSNGNLSENENMFVDEETGQQRYKHVNGGRSDSLEDVRKQLVLLSNISRSDIDLRKHDILTPATYAKQKRSTSLSQADVSNSVDEAQDSLGDLRGYGQPRPSAVSPTHGHRPQIGTAAAAMNYERPWSAAGSKHLRATDLVSERSFVSTSAIPHISTMEAKNRSFLVGSSNSNGSLLGAEELERFFPDRQMRIFIGSWNMCEMKKIPKTLDHFIHPDSVGYVCDMYVIGTQESCPNRHEWEVRLQESLGPHYVLFHSAAFGVLYLNIFIRKDLIWYCSVSEEDSCSTRAGPTSLKTKGGLGVSFSMFGTSFLFINSHFTPHDGKIKDRVEDYKKICRTLDLPRVIRTSKSAYSDPSDVTTRFDSVFWVGDMNWRIMKERERIHSKMRGIESQNIPQYEELLEHDELTKARTQEQVFQDFQEGRIKFKPTYKYDIGTDNYDTSPKLRIPSYTDRILFRTKRKGAMTCLHYDSTDILKESDHRPVFGVYEVNLRPGRDNIPLSAGQFNRDIWLEALKRRALCLDVMQNRKKDKQSSVCSVQ